MVKNGYTAKHIDPHGKFHNAADTRQLIGPINGTKNTKSIQQILGNLLRKISIKNEHTIKQFYKKLQ